MPISAKEATIDMCGYFVIVLYWLYKFQHLLPRIN